MYDPKTAPRRLYSKGKNTNQKNIDHYEETITILSGNDVESG